MQLDLEESEEDHEHLKIGSNIGHTNEAETQRTLFEFLDVICYQSAFISCVHVYSRTRML
jgi:hypothetical protein